MNRPLGHSLLVLPVLAALIAAPAMAQTQGQAQSRSNPMDGLMGLFRQEAQNQPNNVQQDNGSDIESEGLPPPGFGTRNGAPPPVGHQFGDQPRMQPGRRGRRRCLVLALLKGSRRFRHEATFLIRIWEGRSHAPNQDPQPCRQSADS